MNLSWVDIALIVFLQYLLYLAFAERCNLWNEKDLTGVNKVWVTNPVHVVLIDYYPKPPIIIDIVIGSNI